MQCVTSGALRRENVSFLSSNDDKRAVVWFDIDNTLYSETTKVADAMCERVEGASFEFYMLAWRSVFVLFRVQHISHLWGYTKRKPGSFVASTEANTASSFEVSSGITGLVGDPLSTSQPILIILPDTIDYDSRCDGSLPLENLLKPDAYVRQLLQAIDRSKVRVWALTNAYVTVSHPFPPFFLRHIIDLFSYSSMPLVSLKSSASMICLRGSCIAIMQSRTSPVSPSLHTIIRCAFHPIQTFLSSLCSSFRHSAGRALRTPRSAILLMTAVSTKILKSSHVAEPRIENNVVAARQLGWGHCVHFSESQSDAKNGDAPSSDYHTISTLDQLRNVWPEIFVPSPDGRLGSSLL